MNSSSLKENLSLEIKFNTICNLSTHTHTLSLSLFLEKKLQFQHVIFLLALLERSKLFPVVFGYRLGCNGACEFRARSVDGLQRVVNTHTDIHGHPPHRRRLFSDASTLLLLPTFEFRIMQKKSRNPMRMSPKRKANSFDEGWIASAKMLASTMPRGCISSSCACQSEEQKLVDRAWRGWGSIDTDPSIHPPMHLCTSLSVRLRIGRGSYRLVICARVYLSRMKMVSH